MPLATDVAFHDDLLEFYASRLSSGRCTDGVALRLESQGYR